MIPRRSARVVGTCAVLGILILCGPLPAGRKAPAADVRECAVVDKPYRTIAVLPLQNRSGRKEFDYLSSSLSLFLSEDLKNQRTVTIETAEIERPVLTNRRVLIRTSDLSNLRRRLVVVRLSSNSAASTNVDYLLKGSFGPRTNDLWWFRLDLVSRKLGVVLSYTQAADQRSVLDDIPFLTERLKSYLITRRPRSSAGRLILFQSADDFTAVRTIDGPDETRFLGYAPLYFFLEGDRIFTFELDGFRTLATNIRTSDGLSTYSISLRQALDRHKLTVRTLPPGASVYLDEVFLGDSPVEREILAVDRAVLSVVVSNRAVLVRRISVDRDRRFSFDLTTRNRPNRGLFSNRNLAWISLFTGAAVVGYGVWNQIRADTQDQLSPGLRTASPGALRSIASWAFVGSVPIFGLTVLFSARYSDEKDW